MERSLKTRSPFALGSASLACGSMVIVCNISVEEKTLFALDFRFGDDKNGACRS